MDKINRFFNIYENDDQDLENQLETLQVSQDSTSSINLIDLNKLGYEEILITDTPTQNLWNLIPIYNISQIGKDMIWLIYSDPNNERLIIVHGYVDGKKQIEYVKITLNNSGRTFQEQALLEAKKRYNDKISSGYNPKFIDNSSSIIKFQLANNYVPPNKGKTNVINFPVAVQCKIDGIRAGVFIRDNELKKFSRTNKIFKNMWFDNQLKVLLSFLPPNTVLDGEMYSTEVNFNEISSIVRTVKKYNPLEVKIIFYIFDIIIPNMILEERINKLNKAYENYINSGNECNGFIILPTYSAQNYEDLENIHSFYVSNGYEGIMIRNYSTTKKDPKFSYYKGGRNNNLLKYKHFIEEETTIINIESCYENTLELAMFVVKDIRGNIFKVRPSGSFEERIKALNDKNEYIGKMYTIKYFELTPDGVPRFPTGKGLRIDLD